MQTYHNSNLKAHAFYWLAQSQAQQDNWAATARNFLASLRENSQAHYIPSVPLIAPTNMSLQTLEQDTAAQPLHVQFYASAEFRTPDVFLEFGQSTYGPPQLTLSNNAKTFSADFPIRLVDKTATHL